MRGAIQLLRSSSAARLFFAAHTQSSLGTGAAYVGLLLLAYERFESPWAITLVLLADFLPAMFLGPVFGAAADRWSRRGCAVLADVLRAVAFVSLAFVDGFGPTVALALLAGVGTGLFTPAVLAGLPSLVERTKVPPATALYGAIADIGYTIGPVIAALVLLFTDAETLMLVNGVTFGLSALLLARVPFGATPRDDDRRARPRSLLADAREGTSVAARLPGIGVLIVMSAAVWLAAGMFNVGELLLATEELGASEAAFSLLVGVHGAGVVAGSFAGSRGGAPALLKRRYLLGILILGAGLVIAGLAPVYAVALAGFAVAGVGNGLVLVHERLLIQGTVDDSLLGRVFGLKDAATSWAFAISFVAAGAVLALTDTRVLLVVSGAGAVVVCVLAAWLLRGTWDEDDAPAPG